MTSVRMPPAGAEERDYFASMIRWHRDPASGTARRERTVLALLDVRPGETVLDVGAGPGTLAALLAAHGARVVALDPSAMAVAMGRALVREEAPTGAALLLRADGRDLPLADASADAAALCDVVEHLPDDAQDRLLRELRRVLRPRGRLVVTTWPNAANPWWRLRYLRGRGPSFDAFPTSRGRLLRGLARAGFRARKVVLSNWYTDVGVARWRIDGLRGGRVDRAAEALLARLPAPIGDLFASSIAVLASRAD